MTAHSYLPHYTIADWEQWEGKWELIEGIPVAMSPTPNRDHQQLVSWMNYLFVDALMDCRKCNVFAPLDWIVDDENVFEPDILIVCEEEGTWEKKRLAKPPVLVVEIFSPSTINKDKTVKRVNYAKSGIRYYLMLDPEERDLTILENDSGEYLETYSGKGENTTFDLGPCRMEVDLSKVWMKL